MNDGNVPLIGVAWWPHSGGRWFCRSILNQHPKVMGATFVHPWLFYSTDMTMELDITAQVHKARSLPELKKHLAALKGSIDAGRVEGLRSYFQSIADNYLEEGGEKSHIVGEMCLGSPIPRALEVEALFKAWPNFKLIHLVRSPLESFQSFAVRHEMDSDPIKVGGSWLSLNAGIQAFFENNPQYAKQYHMVKYEDLLTNADETIEKVCEFTELEVDQSLFSNMKQRWGRNTKPETPASISNQIKMVAETGLKHYGYL
ncbi:MAG: sulfotransferase [Bacteroidia bacterium]|nr:sulfotransferase [Bacteroidia bacterium]